MRRYVLALFLAVQPFAAAFQAEPAKADFPFAKVELRGVVVVEDTPPPTPGGKRGGVPFVKVGDDRYELDLSRLMPPLTRQAVQELNGGTVLLTGALEQPRQGRTGGRAWNTPLVDVTTIGRAEGRPSAKVELNGELIHRFAPTARSEAWVVGVGDDCYELDLSRLEPPFDLDGLRDLNRRTFLVVGSLELPHRGRTKGKLDDTPLVAASSFKLVQRNYTWNSPNGGAWIDARNWLPVGVPGVGDTVTFTGASTKDSVMNLPADAHGFARVGKLLIAEGYTGRIALSRDLRLDVLSMSAPAATITGDGRYLAVRQRSSISPNVTVFETTYLRAGRLEGVNLAIDGQSEHIATLALGSVGKSVSFAGAPANGRGGWLYVANEFVNVKWRGGDIEFAAGKGISNNGIFYAEGPGAIRPADGTGPWEFHNYHALIELDGKFLGVEPKRYGNARLFRATNKGAVPPRGADAVQQARVELSGELIFEAVPRATPGGDRVEILVVKVGDNRFELDLTRISPPPARQTLEDLRGKAVHGTGSLERPFQGWTRGKLKNTPLVAVSSLRPTGGLPSVKVELTGVLSTAGAPHARPGAPEDERVVWLVRVGDDEYELDFSGLKPSPKFEDLVRQNRRAVLVSGTLELPRQGRTTRGRSLQNVPLVVVSSVGPVAEK